MPQQLIDTLILSMGRRCETCLAGRGQSSGKNIGLQTGRPEFDTRCHQVTSEKECVLVKSVGPKVLWANADETSSAGDWRIFPSPSVPCLNCGGDRWCRHLL
ncbi:hypothetical protein TNCV_3487981 [Trichonephila clavipes]|nr:hypothetical protein TNCV_3487981 [Trichonephila clavipes]